jgi:hypothetical protein
MTTYHAPPAKGNLGPFALRTEDTSERTDPPPTHRIIPSSRRPLSEILADPNYSNGAKLIAAHLDGRCLSFGKWAAWPSALMIAEALGWISAEPGAYPDPSSRRRAERAARKRVERGFRELIEGGDLTRPRQGELVAWYDAEGGPMGFDWPKGLRRVLYRSKVVCVLGWKLAEAEKILPSLTACDIGVARAGPPQSVPALPNVALDTPEMSHGHTPEMSHPMNVRNPNVRSEANTSDVVAVASGEEGRPAMVAKPVAVVETSPAASPDRSRMTAAYYLAKALMGRDPLGNFRGLVPRVGDDGSIEWRVVPGGGPLPDAAELAEIERLKPEVLKELESRGFKVPKPQSVAPPKVEGSPAPAPTAATVPLAPKVPPSKKARVMGMIGALQTAGGPADDVATARAIGDAIGDTKPESIEAFTGYARDVRTGKLSVDALVDAFEAACGKGKTNRGATLVARIQKWKAAHPGWGSDSNGEKNNDLHRDGCSDRMPGYRPDSCENIR